jgi:hypothetical protein
MKDKRFTAFLERPEAELALDLVAIYTLVVGLEEQDAGDLWGVTVDRRGLLRVNAGSQQVFFIYPDEDLWIAAIFVENGQAVRDVVERRRVAGFPVRLLDGGQDTLPHVDQKIIEAEMREVIELLDEPVVVGAISGLVERRSGRLFNRSWSNPDVVVAVLERRRQLLAP